MANRIKIGNLYISALKVGSSDCKVYLGDVKLYPDYLSFAIAANGDIKWSGSTSANTLSYSKDDGETWTTADSTTIISVVKGDKVLWKGTPTPTSDGGIGTFSGDSAVRFDVEGNVMSILFGDNFIGQKSLSGKDYAFLNLFKDNENVVSIDKMVLPATTLAVNCYNSMFYDCTSLTTAPELPATTLATSCYQNMFTNCTSLTTVPELPATTLAESCYRNMFSKCSLTTVPSDLLPATTLAVGCYYSMFNGCTSLTTAPELPATTLAEGCYRNIFSGCTSLTTVPELPATTLTESCYRNMFSKCTSLTTVPSDLLPATTLASNCYRLMFQNCTSLTTAPELPATTLAEGCYYFMFNNCSLTTAPELPATTLAVDCYRSMFQGCTGLTTAPELPATTLAVGCYYQMFNRCTSLTTAPELPGTTLAESCYREMFQGCTSLNYIKAMFTTTPSTSYMSSWVSGVASSGTFIMNSAASWNTGTTACGTSTYPCNWTVDDGTHVVAKFNVTSTSEPTTIIGNFGTDVYSGFSAIEIDGVVQPSVVSAYTFDTTGEHTVKYTLVDQTNLGDIAFEDCGDLTSIVIPDNVITIGEEALRNCDNLENCTIGSGVTSIGEYAFLFCKALSSVTINATMPPTLGEAVFSSNASGRKIYVPSASVNDYKVATNWSTYASDIEPIP